MRKQVATIFTLVALIITNVSCKDKAKEASTTEAKEAVVAEAVAEKFIVDPTESSIEWKGFKPTDSHNGTINIESGVLSVLDNKIESGSFLINMNSIAVLDIPVEEKGNGKLLGHLKSPDFFDTENHANATFEITGVSEVEGKTMLSGNLSIKGIKHNISFLVVGNRVGNGYIISSETFTIDRTRWDIKYKSKSIFGDLGDKFINDDIELKIMIKANKA